MLPRRPKRDAEEDAGHIAQLGVFILLLAFFILLNSLANFDRGKVGAVLQSLKASFPSGPALVGTGGDREAALAQAAREVASVGDLFLARIPVARIEASSDGPTMAVTLPADEIVMDGRVRPDRADLLGRVAEVLGARATGLQVRLEFLMGADDPGVMADTAPALITASGALARDLAGRGADPAFLSVGLERRQSGWVRFLFTIRDPAGPVQRLPTAPGDRP